MIDLSRSTRWVLLAVACVPLVFLSLSCESGSGTDGVAADAASAGTDGVAADAASAGTDGVAADSTTGGSTSDGATSGADTGSPDDTGGTTGPAPDATADTLATGGDDATTTGGGGIEIAGTWTDDYGYVTDVSDQSFGPATVIAFDNAANWVITQNPSDDEYFPDKFSKTVWTEPADQSFWVCTVAYGLDTAENARTTTETADSTDPATGGCGGFPWTRFFQGSGN